MNNNDNQPRRRNIYPGVRKPADNAPKKQNTKSESACNTSVDTGTPTVRRVNPIEAARRKKEKKLITTAAVVVLLFLAVIIALVAKSCGLKENTDDFSVLMESKVTVPYTDIVRNGTVYLNATDLAYFCEMTISGSYDELKLSSDSGAYAVFLPDSDKADVNGTELTMPTAAILDNDELWLPLDFISSTFVGITITVNRDINKITITRTELDGSTSDNPVYADITFTIANLPAITEDNIIDMINSYEFKTDISKYAAYLNPADDSKYLLLVNKTTSLDSAYIPSQLVSIDTSLIIYSSDIQLEQYTKFALEAMMTEMRAAGYTDIFVSSGYRSYSKQSILFNTYINNEMAADTSLSLAQAIEKVKQYSAVAGTSEHQSGLCIDFISDKMAALDDTFAQNPAYDWLIENSYKFGFILRYPKDKTATTGYTYEPWHFRFVGQYHAAAMHESGLCLEEYIYKLNHSK